MNENTKNKFAEILKAAQDKANGQKPINPANLKANEPGFKPEVKDIFPDPIPEPVKEEQKQELSSITVDDLLNDSITPKEEKRLNLRLIDYSDKSFAVIGDTKPIKDTLRILGGSFNSRLTCGMGWIFSKKRLDSVKKELNLTHLVLC